jgi:hypothetical protein
MYLFVFPVSRPESGGEKASISLKMAAPWTHLNPSQRLTLQAPKYEYLCAKANQGAGRMKRLKALAELRIFNFVFKGNACPQTREGWARFGRLQDE